MYKIVKIQCSLGKFGMNKADDDDDKKKKKNAMNKRWIFFSFGLVSGIYVYIYICGKSPLRVCYIRHLFLSVIVYCAAFHNKMKLNEKFR